MNGIVQTGGSGPYAGRIRRAGAPMRVVRVAGLAPYGPFWDLQKHLWRRRLEAEIPDTLLLLEHSPVITLGRRAHSEHVVSPAGVLTREGIEVVEIDRGGDVTYHGPGQITGYLIADLRDLALDLHVFVRALEEVMIRALARFGVRGERVRGLTGVWVGGEKIGAIGVHMSRWVSTHGFAFNVSPDLRCYRHIVPCGIPNRGVTSLSSLIPAERSPSVGAVGEALGRAAAEVFRRSPSWVSYESPDQALRILRAHPAEALCARAGESADDGRMD